jgi:quercetin dioxygenase-like cupin family protein
VTLPKDDPARNFTLAQSDDPNLPHIGVVGDTYTILVTGKDTAGHYALIDMHILPGGGPPHHRHDFEEMFSVLEGEIEATLRGKQRIIRAGETINIPANAPHQFQNKSRQSAPNASPMLTCRAGRVFQGSRSARRNTDNTAAPAR